MANSSQSGYFLGELQSSQKSLNLLSAVYEMISEVHELQGEEPRQNGETNKALTLRLKSSLNLLARELHLPFLLLSIQNEHSDEAIIAESSIVQNGAPRAERGAQRKPLKTRNISYRLGEGIIGMVTKSKQPYFCPDIHRAPEFLNRTGLKEQFAGTAIGFLCLPIVQSQGSQGSQGSQPTLGSQPSQGSEQNAKADDRKVIGTLSTGLYYKESLPGCEARDSSYRLDSPLFSCIRELGAFLRVVCSLMVNTVKLHIELELEQQLLQQANTILRSRAQQNQSLQQMIGRSSAMQQLFVQITQVAEVDTTVLLLGESGTGKELAARAIHQSSRRAKKPFVAVNCAALPEGLIDSELFGHARGAFTGSMQNYKGRFELAEGGTLFLDEVSELPLNLQSKLLRVLQEKEYQPLGSERSRRADVRIIAASNHNLEQDVQERNFREDLFFRLSVFPIRLPPLRERKSDITMLVNHFLKKNVARLGINVVRVADSAISLLMSYNWPGNVRELENVIERASILCEEGVIYAHHLPPTLQSGKSSKSSINYTLKEALERLELDMLYEALKDNKGNMRLAARGLGITERQIGLRMSRYKLEYKDFRE